MSQLIKNDTVNVNVLASINEESKGFFNSYFKNIDYEVSLEKLSSKLETNRYDMIIVNTHDFRKIEDIRLNYPQLRIVVLIQDQNLQELKKLLQLPIGAIELTSDNSEAVRSLQYYVEKINHQKRTIEKIVSLEDKIKEFEKLLKVYGENVIASVTDTKGVIKYATKAFCDIGGYDEEDLVGQPHNIIRHPDMPKKVFKKIWKTIEEGRVWKGEIKNRKKDGGFYWVYATISPELNEKGEIIGYSAIRQDITDKKHIEELSITDSLTSLYNRRHFNETVLAQLKLAKRYNLNLNFLLIDLDHFKNYNDTYGHHQGDIVLQSFSKVIKDTFRRPDDYAFRLGGEEFGILFYSKKDDDTLDSANRLIENLAALKIPHEKNSASTYATISAGLYSIKNGIDDKNSLFKYCDEALYEAKRSGRNQIIKYGG